MSDKQVVNKNKKSDSKKDFLKKLKALASVVALSALIIAGIYIFGGFEAADELFYYSRMEVDSSVVSDGGFPVNFTGNDIISVRKLDSKIFVLNKKMLTCLSSEGKPLFTETFTFVEPQMNVGEKYGIIYDRSSSAYILFNERGVVFRGNTEGERHIIFATVDNHGNCAFSVKSDDSACRVYMIDKKGKIRYIWSCSEEYAVSLDISSDGKKIVCGTIGAYSNEVFTKVYYLDTESENVRDFRLDGSACIDITFVDKNKAAVSCTDKRVIIDLRTDDGNSVETNYSGELVQFTRDFDGNAVVITDKINSFDSDEITMYDKNNTVVFRCDAPQDSSQVLLERRYTYSLSGDKITKFKRDGTVIESLRCDVIPGGIVHNGSDICYYNLGSIKNDF